jgi:hypothetical protein
MAVVCPGCDHPVALEALSAGVCTHCGRQLAALPAIDISKLSLLDERDLPPNESPAVRAAAFGPPELHAPAPSGARDRFAPPSAFAPPPDGSDQPLGVERSTRAIRIESQWERERAAKQAEAALPPPPPPRKPIGGILAAVALIAAVTAGVVAIVRQPVAPKPPHVPGEGVSIRIVAHDPTDVTIDGAPAGKTPLTLRRPEGAQPLLIASPHKTKQVIPDHDQVVDLSSP